MSGLSGALKSAKAQLDTIRNVLADLEVSQPLERMLRGFADFIGRLVETTDEGEYVREGQLRLIGSTLKWGSSLLIAGVALRLLSFLLGGLAPLVRGLMLLTSLWGLAFAGAGFLILKRWEPIAAFFRGFWTGFTQSIDRMEGSLGRLWGWIKALFNPIEYSKEELDRFTESGREVRAQGR